MLIEKTIDICDDNYPTYSILTNEFAKKLGIEHFGASMSSLDDCDGNKHLLVTKFHREIAID
jgi:hypothetical protein